MTNHKKQFFALLAILLPMLWFAVGCTKEDVDNCQSDIKFTIKAYDADKLTELANSTVKDVVLYVFDRNYLFVREITAKMGSTIEIAPPDDEQFTVVALGNSGGGNETRPVYNVGDHISVGLVALKATRANTIYITPDDLFLGSLTIHKETLASKSERIIPLYRKTGSMNIAIRGLKQYAGVDDNNYSVVVNTVNRAFSLEGKSTPGEVSYMPKGAFNAAGEFIVPPFNIFASSSITIDIYHSTQLLANVSSTVAVNEGMTTQVRLTFKDSITIAVDILDWGTETVWKEYN